MRQRVPHLVPDLAAATLTHTTAWGAAAEVASLVGQLLRYPVDIAADRHRHATATWELAAPPLRPERPGTPREPTRAGTPVLLVPGFAGTSSIFEPLRRALRRDGADRTHIVSYSPLTGGLRTAAELLSTEVEALCGRTGRRRVHLVGHSLGGLIARYFVQRLGGDRQVDVLVTLGTPHGGITAARLLPWLPLVGQLVPHSAAIAELALPAPGCRTRFVAFYRDLDEVVIPSTRARIDHPDLRAENILVPGVGHLTLPVDAVVVRRVCALLLAAGEPAR
ncbi:esterase/lipase family protein [Gandjariella thermophila]|nr:alpha/beta fold hydrolase [Gandjariella thermophila]